VSNLLDDQTPCIVTSTANNQDAVRSISTLTLVRAVRVFFAFGISDCRAALVENHIGPVEVNPIDRCLHFGFAATIETSESTSEALSVVRKARK